MKKILMTICIFVSFSLCGCSQQPQNYVKDILIKKNNDLYEMTIVSYDFSSEEESFKKDVYYSDNIFLLGSNAISDGDFSLRLCESCYISAELFDEINRIVYMLNSIRFPPASSVICLQGNDIEENEESEKNKDYFSPLYNLKINSGKVTGTFSIVDKSGENTGILFVHNGVPVKFLDKKQTDIFNILANRADSIDYHFWENQVCTRLDIIDCYFSTENDNMIITINLFSGSITGINNYMQDEEFYMNILKYELENDVYSIFSDPVINSVYNLQWYPRRKTEEFNDLTIRLNIM